jgi:hypothetical protein
MKTVQVAIHDSEQADTLRELLVGDGVHQVHVLERPNMAIAGVIVMDIDHLERSGALFGARDRLVVMASRASADLTTLWRAGVRHVVFQGDAPTTVRLAVLATELSLTAPNFGVTSLSPEAADTQKSNNPPQAAFRESTKPTQCRARKGQPKS